MRNYLTVIVTKLHARNRVDAIKIAYDAGGSRDAGLWRCGGRACREA